MTERKDPLAHMIPREGLRDVDILILDALADAGGSATRDDVFDRVDRKLWGHMAGQDGDKRQTVEAAIERLLQQRGIVPHGTDKAPAVALHPTRRLSRLVGGKPYIPGTELWKGDRDLLLSEVHRQLAVHLKEVEAARAKFLEHFEPERARLLALVKDQVERGRLEGDDLADMLVALSKLWLGPSDIASQLDMAEPDVAASMKRRAGAAPKRAAPVSGGAAPMAPDAAPKHNGAAPMSTGAATNLTRMIALVRRKGGSMSASQVSKYLHLSGADWETMANTFKERYPECVEYGVHPNSRGNSHHIIYHAPPDEP